MPFIYGLRDPRDWTIRYVGRAGLPQNRYTVHLRHGAPRVRVWVSELRRCSLRPDLVILEECSWGLIYRQREQYWIDHYHAERPLLNTVPAMPSSL